MRTAQHHISFLTFHEDADVCVCGLRVGGGVRPQPSLEAIGGPGLPIGPPANSGKSVIFTSNGAKSSFAGLDFPSEFGADLALLKPKRCNNKQRLINIITIIQE